MSQENVDLVIALQPAPEQDTTQLWRDDRVWEVARAALGQLFHDDFECTFPLPGSVKIYVGVEGMRAAWLDWLAPWASYRTEIEKAIDLGDRVLLLIHDYGRREGSAAEVRGNVAAMWTLRAGKIVRVDFYADRSEAFRDAGL
ncbi:MAG TPA: nuclear transport factor 2 family protein [Solirubrobacteraceae bacterium]|nr:nuclear transport factor 2 family protein [Solirubrobacteraceae bacterium]